MAASQGTVVVKGYRELDRAFRNVSKDVSRTQRAALKVVAEPARAAAEQLAVGNITNIGSHWSRMRLGVLARGVYLAPTSRRTSGGSPRPNLAPLLMDRAMQPAVDQNEDKIIIGLEHWLDGIAIKNGF